MFDSLLAYLESLAEQIPLPIFALIGSVIDELMAIFVPSPFVPLTAGSMAASQNQAFGVLFLIALTGTIGKTIATLLTYWVADKAEDWLTTSKLGKIIGVDKNEVERYGRYFNGTHRDEVIMIVLRALPFIPTLPVSVLAGLIKLNLVTFMVTTFIGTYLRFMIYLVVAYEGVKKYQGLLDTLDSTTTILEITIVLAVAGWGFFFLRKRWDKILGYFFAKNKKS